MEPLLVLPPRRNKIPRLSALTIVAHIRSMGGALLLSLVQLNVAAPVAVVVVKVVSDLVEVVLVVAVVVVVVVLPVDII